MRQRVEKLLKRAAERILEPLDILVPQVLDQQQLKSINLQPRPPPERRHRHWRPRRHARTGIHASGPPLRMTLSQ